jgi:prepilin-type N-terminal cleavage/methylation domain-containing protein
MEHKQKHTKKGFTLPEIIISISVLTMTITAATSIMTSVLRSNADNLDNLTAYGLAQEGIEVMRNVRDSDWVLGLDFAGGAGNSSNSLPVWGAKLAETNQLPQYFAFAEKSSTACLSIASKDNSDATNCAPWTLIPVAQTLKFDDSGNLDPVSLNSKMQVFKRNAENSGKDLLFYQTKSGFADNGDETLKFYRFVKVTALKSYLGDSTVPIPTSCDKNGCLRYRVTSAVYWLGSNGVTKHVTLSTELTNWKK